MAEFEFAGTTFRGGKMFAILTALSTLGGGAWGGFEIYKDYMDMKEIIQEIDIDEINAANVLQVQKLEDAIGYTQDIKQDLKADIDRLEALVESLEGSVETSESKVRSLRTEIYAKIDAFEERFRLTLKDNQDVMANLRDKIASELSLSEARIKTTQADIGATLEGVRTEMNTVQNSVTKSIREVESVIRETEKDVRDTMRATEERIELDQSNLEERMRTQLQEALDNPLAN